MKRMRRHCGRSIDYSRSMVQDLRYAWRRITAAPLFSASVVAMVALGVGANAAVFAVVQAALFRPLPYPGADHILIGRGLAPGVFLDWARQSSSFSALAGYTAAPLDIGPPGLTERVDGLVVSGAFFAVAGVPPAFGRTLTSADADHGERALVVSDSVWRRNFEANPAILGRSTLVNGETFTIVGVMPPGFRFPFQVDAWIPARHPVPEHPLRPFEDPSQVRSSIYLGAAGRLRAGATVRSAQMEQRAIFENIRHQYPDDVATEDVDLGLTPLRTWLLGDTGRSLVTLSVAASLVLVVVCLNLATLLLARFSGRRREMAIRAAVGAGRWRIARQLLVESGILAACGGVFAVLLTLWSLPAVVHLLPEELRSFDPSIGPSVWLFGLGTSALAGVLFGLGPLAAVKRQASISLLAGGRTTEGRTVRRTWDILIAVQFAVSFAFIVTAALLYASVHQLLSTDVGFVAQGLQTSRIDLPATQYPDEPSQARFFDRLLTALRTHPDVHDAAAIARLPFSGADSTRSIVVVGSDVRDAWAGIRVVSPEYLRALSVPVTHGRPLDDFDRATAPPVAIVNTTMARRYWGSADVIGRRFRLGPDGVELTIVGQVADSLYASLRESPEPEFYVSYRQMAWPFMSVVLRTGLPRDATDRLLRRALQTIDPTLAAAPVRRVTDLVRGSVDSDRVQMLGVSAFGAITCVVAAIGLYGVTAYLVSSRKKELAILIALGAGRMRIVTNVLLRALLPLSVGMLGGVVASAAVVRGIRASLYGVQGSSPVIYLVTAAALVVVGIVATLRPALTAARVDPLTALRSE
jgi:putative ABC transport system permease protein